MQDAFIHNGSQKIHYYRVSTGSRTLILLHGFTDNGLCWPRLVESLKDRFDIIMMDGRGHGLSDAPESGYTPELQAGDVVSLINQLQVEKPVLIGHSLGAEIAAVTAVLYPDMTSAVVLVDPPWFDIDVRPAGNEMELRIENLRKGIEAKHASSFEQLMLFCAFENPTWDECEREPWAISKKQVSSNAAAGINEQWPDWRQVAAKITCPVLLAYADNDKGGIITPGLAAEALGYWKNSRVVHFANAGHSIHREQFGPFLTSVIWFLRHIWMM
ncbi:MAG: alpha/beta hydrolase [Anaerolineaceae bacterium]